MILLYFIVVMMGDFNAKPLALENKPKEQHENETAVTYTKICG